MEEKDKALVDSDLIDCKKCDRVEDFAATEEKKIRKNKNMLDTEKFQMIFGLMRRAVTRRLL